MCRGEQDKPPESTAVDLIREVQNLYCYGVKVGLLQANDRFDSYLKNMKTRYAQVSLLGDGSFGRDADWNDGKSDSEADHDC